MTSENLQIGARGWHHSNWQESYYPDDMPEEWQLTFYANEFNVVLVPKDYWDKQKGYDLENWLDEVEDDFRFYLEYPSIKDEEESELFQRQCNLIGESLGGVLITETDDLSNMELSCPIVKDLDVSDTDLNLGLITKDFSELRKVRSWLDEFDNNSTASQKVVFVTNLETPDVSVSKILEIKSLVEMMGL